MGRVTDLKSFRHCESALQVLVLLKINMTKILKSYDNTLSPSYISRLEDSLFLLNTVENEGNGMTLSYHFTFV